MRKLLWAGIAVFALAACTPTTIVKIGPAISVRCQEDMPCWDCHTMGNRQCGPTSTTLSLCAQGDEPEGC